MQDMERAPLPLDPFVRRADWQLAALLVALVAVPGFASRWSRAAAADDPVRSDRADAAIAASARSNGRRTVRPPRAC